MFISTQTMSESRAVLLTLNGPAAICTTCGEAIRAKGTPSRNRTIIVNVYEQGRWRRVEAYCPTKECYDGRYGEPTVKPPTANRPARLRK